MTFILLILPLFLFFGLIVALKRRTGNSKRKAKLPPGPTGLPVFGYLPFLGSIPCLTVSRLSRKWGSIFTLRLGQYPVVFLHDFHMIKRFYKLDCSIGRAQLALFEKRGTFGLGLLEGEKWKEMKRFLLRCLKDSGFGKCSMENAISQEVSQAVHCIRSQSQSGASIYMKPVLELAVINALWFILTGEKYDIEDPSKREVAEIMSEGLSDQNIVGILAFLPWLAKLFPKWTGYKKALSYFEAPEQLAKTIIAKHQASYNSGNERDFVDLALGKIYGTKEKDSVFYGNVGIKNLRYTLIDLFFAGSDTMSSTLGWAFLYLAIWPKAQKKIQLEIDEVVGSVKGGIKSPSLKDRTRMPYTEAAMWEVLRLSVLLPFGLLHRTLEEVQFEGFSFPKNTLFLANLYHLFRGDAEYWGDPEEFRPERFLLQDGTFQKNERLIPFFTGKRTCIGEGLAMNQFFLFLTGILQSFSFSLNPEEPIPDIGPQSGFILTPPKHKLKVNERG